MPRTLNILTVDDEPSVTQSISFALSGPTRDMSMATDGADALAQVSSRIPTFDLVITDNNMPRLTGLELVRNLRERNFAGKIIVLSAYLTDELLDAYCLLKVDRVLAKPFDLRELRDAVQEVAQVA